MIAAMSLSAAIVAIWYSQKVIKRANTYFKFYNGQLKLILNINKDLVKTHNEQVKVIEDLNTKLMENTNGNRKN